MLMKVLGYKKSTLLILLCLIAWNGFSQFKYKHRNTRIQNEFRYGPRIGLQQTNMFFKKADQEYEAKGILGYNAGFMMEYTIQEIVALQTGLVFVTGGTKASTVQNRDVIQNNINLNYLRVPFFIVPRFEQNEYTIFVAFGAYAGYGINGKESAVGDTAYSSKITFQETSGQVTKHRFDFGLNVGGGVEYNNFQFAINYSLGLYNITTTPNIINNKILMFTIGYMFGGKY